jgi:hypothetical protein
MNNCNYLYTTRNMELVTIQKQGIDITSNIETNPDYTDSKGAYYDLAQHLGWKRWIWCFRGMKDFSHDHMIINQMYCLWVLKVPREDIIWASFERSYEMFKPSDTIFPDADYIEHELGETPMALVQSPVKAEWVIGKWTLAPCTI